MAFSWSWVYRFVVGLQGFMSESCKWFFLSEKLSEESIRILIGSSFPGRVWMSKIETHSCLIFDDGMVCKLSSIIWCESFLICLGYIYKHISETITDIVCCLLLGMRREKKTTCTIYGGNHSMASGLCRYNGIYLPMSKFSSLATGNRERMIYFSLLDHHSVLYLVFFFSCFHLLLVLLSSSAKIIDEIWIVLFEVSVNRIFWEFFSLFHLPSSSNLIWWVSPRFFCCSSETREHVLFQVTSWQNSRWMNLMIRFCPCNLSHFFYILG